MSITYLSQLAIKSGAKLRRVGLADRLGRLAMELQEREEEHGQELEQEEEEEVEESQDMFAPTQENPFLNNRETSSAKPVRQGRIPSAVQETHPGHPTQPA